jgi:STE24 endopeptidase
MPPRSRGVLVASIAALVLAGALAAMVAVVTPWNPMPGGHIDAPPVDEFFTPAQIARSEALFDAARWPSWIGLILHLAVAVAVAFTPIGRRLIGVVRSHVRRWWLQVPVLVGAVLVIDRLVTLPTAVWGERIARDYGLSTQSWGSWAIDLTKSMAINFVLLSLVLLGLIGLARRFTRTWFVPAAAGAAALVLGLSFAYPVAIEPVFNSFRPLQAGPLRSKLLELADQSDVQVSDVLVADASRRTSSLNAYVSGFGATKRIVLFDTLLNSASNREIELIVAHELGHASTDDVLVGTYEGAIAAALAVVLLFLVLRPGLLRRPTGAGSVGDPAVVPLILGLVVVVTFLASPVQNTISRRIEARADLHSLELTGDPEGFISMQQRLAVTNITHLTPSPVLSFWFGSHPTTMGRIGMALEWEKQHSDGTR